MPVNNVWKMTAKDNKGEIVESAPGLKSFIMRGPTSDREARRRGQQILNHMMMLDWETAGRDPEFKSPDYRVERIEPMGNSDPTLEPETMWRPPGAQPVKLSDPSERDIIEP